MFTPCREMPLPEPGHPARRARRRPRARARVRQPRLPPRRGGAHPAALRRRSAGSPAGSSSAAGSATPLMQPGRFTELFFLDEATAFAAGHRPCALCRREDYVRFREIWRELHPGQAAPTRSTRGSTASASTRRARQRHHAAPFDELPDGAFVLRDGAPWLVLGSRAARVDAGRLHRASAAARARARSAITPPSLVAVLRAGWEPLVPLLHPSARIMPGDLRARAGDASARAATRASDRAAPRAGRLRQGARAALPRTPGGRRAGRHRFGRRPAAPALHAQGRPARHLSVRHVRRPARGGRSASTAPRGRPAS